MRRRPNLKGLLSKTLILLFIALHVETIPLNRHRVSQQFNETFVVKSVSPTREISSISGKRNFSAEIRRNHSKVKRETTCDPGASLCPYRNETTGSYDCLRPCQECDGFIDCPRATDEIGCPCRTRLSPRYICDGEIDCADYSDELGCGECFNDEFRCFDECVSIKDLCSGKKCGQFSRHLICSRLARTPFEHTDTTYRSKGYLQMLIRHEWLTVCGKISELTNIVAKDYCYEITGIRENGQIVTYKETSLIESIKWAELKMENNQIFASKNDDCREKLVVYVDCPPPLAQTERESLFNIKITERIVGGDEAKDEDWRFLVRILKNSEHHCGGSILSDRWILSASHCFLKITGVRYEIEAGSIKTGAFGPRVQRRLVSHIIRHPFFDPYTMSNDVALARVLTPLHMTKWIRPSLLLKHIENIPENIPEDAACFLAGWGYQSEEGNLAKMLQEVSVPILEDDACVEEFLYIDPEKVICAGHKKGRKDSCQGDSGGPMMCNLCSHPYDPSECAENFWIQVAIVSFGRGCARPGIPGVYTNVKYFANWILDTVEIMSDNSNALPGLVPQIVCNGMNCEYINGTCLPMNRICDQKVDCLKAEDEISCANPLRSNYFNGIDKNGNEDDYNDEKDNKDYDDSKNEDYNDFESQSKNQTNSCPDNHFKCEIIPGCIPNSLLCDEVRNCRDGSDELRCTCVDRIFLTHRQKICNGVFDCPDKTDEFCDLCGANEWYCRRSGECVSIENVCDVIPHCKYGEDELNCLALAPEEGILTVSEGGHPTISNNGFVLIYSAKSSTWDPVCQSEMSHQVAEDICYYLGFTGPQSIKYNSNLPSTYEIRQGGGGSPREKRFISLLEAKHDFKISSQRLGIGDRPWQLQQQQNFKALQEKTTSGLVVVKNFTKDELDDGLVIPYLPLIAEGGDRRAFETPTGGRRAKRMACNQVRLECGEKICGKIQALHFNNAPPLSDEINIPWAVKIYSSGEYLCEGTLIASEWVLCSSECMADLSFKEKELHILGGSHRGIFGFPYMTPSEVDIRIDAIVDLEDESKLTLLHLEESTHKFEQLNSVCFTDDNLEFPSWKECLIVGTYEDDGSETFLLVPKEKCEEDKLCFEDYLPLQEVCLKSWPGLIACRKERKSTSPWTAVGIFNFDNENCFNFKRPHQKISKELVEKVYKKIDDEVKIIPPLKCDGHKCPLGLCISNSKVCDGRVSCADISDEGYSCPLSIKLCTVRNGKCECPPNDFKCSDGVCITADRMCDGVADCLNGEDEEKCSCLEKIEKENAQMLCNGIIDCKDETDELDCGCDLNEEFRCYKSSNQSCIPGSLICDAVADCEKGEDEAHCFTISTTIFPEENILGVPSFNNKGYLLLRVKGMWYTYFYHNWSSSNSDVVCQSFGYRGQSETKGIYLNPSIFTSKASNVLPVSEGDENKLVVYITCSV